MKKYLQIIRRWFFVIFRRKYVENSVSKRKGQCKHCSCCEVKLFGRKWNCSYYDSKTKQCRVYNTDKMRRTCFYYPFDERDKWDEFKDKCGFFWDEARDNKKATK